ncbi:MAG: type II toxin-antitoxin system RelE/ParE family toxin [Spirochaetales bacterium]|nr:type II toxin-antitoxin system RelE/ParE family toxin [Spirochaetales bacterium]
MTYKISILRRAQKQLTKIPANDYKKVKQAIIDLAQDPRPAGSKKLKGRQGWRIRQGDFRVIYEIQDDKLIILVLDVGNRKDVYR